MAKCLPKLNSNLCQKHIRKNMFCKCKGRDINFAIKIFIASKVYCFLMINEIELLVTGTSAQPLMFRHKIGCLLPRKFVHLKRHPVKSKRTASTKQLRYKFYLNYTEKVCCAIHSQTETQFLINQKDLGKKTEKHLNIMPQETLANVFNTFK